jgi:hypothetical protein
LKNHIWREAEPGGATSGRTQKNDCSRAAGVNDPLTAAVIQLDVSLACYACVEVVASIG